MFNSRFSGLVYPCHSRLLFPCAPSLFLSPFVLPPSCTSLLLSSLPSAPNKLLTAHISCSPPYLILAIITHLGSLCSYPNILIPSLSSCPPPVPILPCSVLVPAPSPPTSIHPDPVPSSSPHPLVSAAPFCLHLLFLISLHCNHLLLHSFPCCLATNRSSIESTGETLSLISVLMPSGFFIARMSNSRGKSFSAPEDRECFVDMVHAWFVWWVGARRGDGACSFQLELLHNLAAKF